LALNLNCDYPINNAIIIMMLRDSHVVYGDEQRNKQAHIFDHHIYHTALLESMQKNDDIYWIDLSSLIKQHDRLYLPQVSNNVFFTTKALREYHYNKQKKNAFYHIQAINLPFPNLEFFWTES